MPYALKKTFNNLKPVILYSAGKLIKTVITHIFQILLALPVYIVFASLFLHRLIVKKNPLAIFSNIQTIRLISLYTLLLTLNKHQRNTVNFKLVRLKFANLNI